MRVLSDAPTIRNTQQSVYKTIGCRVAFLEKKLEMWWENAIVEVLDLKKNFEQRKPTVSLGK